MKQHLTVGTATGPLLEAYGVEYVFGIPGNHTLELHRGLENTRIRHVTTRHEQGAAFMADGYARVSGQPGVCFVISGPGLLNAATAITQANQDSVPLLVIATVSSAEPGTGALHQMPDQAAVAGGLARASFNLAEPDDLAEMMSNAFDCIRARPGAVIVQIPTDMLTLPAVQPAALNPQTSPREIDVAEVASLLDAATQPLMLLGGGARTAAGTTELAERLDCPVLNTVNGKGIVAYGHPLAVGGSPSLPCVRQALADADVVLALGTEFSETDFDLLMSETPPTAARVIQINLDPVPAPGIQGDTGQVVTALNANLKPDSRGGEQRATALRTAIRREPHYHADFAAFFEAIQAAADDLVLVGDSTRPTYYAAWMYETRRPNRYFHSASGFGTLGYAIPAAFGACLATQLPVVAIIGDGGAQFTLSELATAVDNHLGVPIIIWLNDGYEEIAHSFAAREVNTRSTAILSPDYALIAQAYGCRCASPASPGELTDAVREALADQRPSLILVEQNTFIHSPSGQWYA
jgi:acetolactate synthase-1/2/3 large subunit